MRIIGILYVYRSEDNGYFIDVVYYNSTRIPIIVVVRRCPAN